METAEGGLGDALISVLKTWKATDPRERQELARAALALLDRPSAQARVSPGGSTSPVVEAPRGPVMQRAELGGVNMELRGGLGHVQAFWSPRHEETCRLFMRAWLEDAQGRRGRAWDQVQRDRLLALRYDFLFDQAGFLPVMARTLAGNEPLKQSGKSRPGSLGLLSVKVCGPNFVQSRLEEMNREVLHCLYAEHNSEPVRQDTVAWLRSVRAALRPGGRLVVTEKADTYKTLEIPAQLLREAGFSEVVAHEDGLRFLVATVAR